MTLFFKNSKDNEYGLIGYKAINTITDSGEVKRGVCSIENGLLTNLEECIIKKDKDTLTKTPLNTTNTSKIDNNTLVSMNMFCLKENIFKYLNNDIKEFFNNEEQLKNGEYLIGDVISRMVDDKIINVKVLETNSIWLGMTYKEDKESLVNEINNFIKKGIYPPKL